jgi:ankyrin repeat protein
LNNKTDPNICFEEKSPLYIASKNGYSEIVKLLLKNGTNITSCAKSPLYVSVKVCNTDIVAISVTNIRINVIF